ncbi:hypothetical protein, partial [Burkholderia sp. SIMBA_062]|uniref:hypothetical protein n=1 Tax=Burkholderia sp. SIMBA_062 TaxID=3085803 RepID=UPI00397BE82C
RNRSSYFAMKNTPKVGSVSNFWGAVHSGGLFHCRACWRRRVRDVRYLFVTLRNIRALRPQNRCYIVMTAENILMDQ